MRAKHVEPQCERRKVREALLRREGVVLRSSPQPLEWHETVEHKTPDIGSMGSFQCVCLELSILNYARVTISTLIFHTQT